jgi:putative protease
MAARKKARTKRKKAPARRPAARKKTAKAKKSPAKKARQQRRAAPKARKPAARVAAAKPAVPVVLPPPGERIGTVTHYFSHISVAVIKLETGALRVGDTIHIRGHTSDFSQRVDSLQVDHASVPEVGPRDDFGVKVREHARVNDVVYKLVKP